VREPLAEVEPARDMAQYRGPVDASVDTDADALEAFVVEHYGRLIRLAGLVCGSVDEAEDAVQAGLERAWRKRATLQDPSALRPWLDKIVVREAIRTKGRRVMTSQELVLDQSEVDRADTTAALRLAFEELPTDQRAVVVLHLYMGYSVEATAQIVGARTETVRSRLRLARERLRHLLRDED
jgi:RNA polymerase sigma-70 factor (ECF subfamily)